MSKNLRKSMIRRRFILPSKVTFEVIACNINQAFWGARIFMGAVKQPLVPARSKRFIDELNNAV